jgi:RecB family exonuclease
MVSGPESDNEQRLNITRTPHLSFSRVERYLHCPEQYRLYYVENLRPKLTSASLVFGQTIHEALAQMFKQGQDPISSFRESWKEAKQAELKYSTRESWDKLNDCGQTLLEKFVQEQVPRLSNISAIEKPFELNISEFDLPFIGFIDLTAKFDGLDTVIDFKTSASGYVGYEAIMSDQLTAYQLAMPNISTLGLCVLIKAKEPRIEWHLTHRSGAQLVDYLRKAKLVAREIKAGHFYKRPGKWCSWCDYLPVCLGDTRKMKEEFVRIR